jgi:hypothetical protein
MIIPLLTLLTTLVVHEPWALVSQITRQQCHQGQCQPFARQRGPQERLVQTFGTAEECLKVREVMLRRVGEAEGPVNQVVHDRHPAWYMRLRTTLYASPQRAQPQRSCDESGCAGTGHTVDAHPPTKCACSARCCLR